ncbi:hypothetical protein BHM03_00055310 [Ensete ventricosum]|nr:hypothetical protein BHM03_00055310 [Ensete ventricosum]
MTGDGMAQPGIRILEPSFPHPTFPWLDRIGWMVRETSPTRKQHDIKEDTALKKKEEGGGLPLTLPSHDDDGCFVPPACYYRRRPTQISSHHHVCHQYTPILTLFVSSQRKRQRESGVCWQGLLEIKLLPSMSGWRHSEWVEA